MTSNEVPSGSLSGVVRSVDERSRGYHRARHPSLRKIIIAILVNAEKSPLFSMQERVDIVRETFRQPNVEVDTFDGLLVDYVERRSANVIVRGLRALSDFETEFQMALMNRRLSPNVETVFMMPAEQYLHQLAAHQGSLFSRRPGARPGPGNRGDETAGEAKGQRQC